MVCRLRPEVVSDATAARHHNRISPTSPPHAGARMPWNIEQHGAKLLGLEHIDMLYDTCEQDKRAGAIILATEVF